MALQTITVGPSGRDYTTIQGAIDSLSGSLADPYEIVVDAGTYAENVDVSGFTPSASNFVTIKPARGSHHGAVAGAGVLIEPSTTGHAVTLSAAYTVLDGLEITQPNGTTSDEGVRVAADECRVRYCLIHDIDDSDTEGDGIYVEGDYVLHTYGNIIYDCTQACIDIYGADSASAAITLHCVNNTLAGSTYGVWVRNVHASATVTVNLWNTISVLNTTDWSIDSDATADGDHNLSEDALPTGVQGVASCDVGDSAAAPTGDSRITFLETAAGSEDYRLDDSVRQQAMKFGAGHNRTGYSDRDVTGALRPSSFRCDAGAHEISTWGPFATESTVHDMNGSTGIQAFTCPTGRGEPVAAIFVMGSATSDGSTGTDAQMVIGATDGRWAGMALAYSADALVSGAARTARELTGSDDRQILQAIRYSSGLATVGEADFLHFTDGGCVLDVTQGFGDTERVMVKWFFGSDLGADLQIRTDGWAAAASHVDVEFPNLAAINGTFAFTSNEVTGSLTENACIYAGWAEGAATTTAQGCVGWASETRRPGFSTTIWSNTALISTHDFNGTTMAVTGEGLQLDVTEWGRQTRRTTGSRSRPTWTPGRTRSTTSGSWGWRSRAMATWPFWSGPPRRRRGLRTTRAQASTPTLVSRP